MNCRLYVSVFLFLMLFITGCGESHKGEIELAYKLAQTNPDSSLVILRNLYQEKFSKKEHAEYSLIYTIAQDKSGLDVDNDSLLRTAYTYYNIRTDDSLYALCEYYMGKYYMLNDSTELAMDCFQKSVDAAERQADKYTQCLALEKLARLTRQTNPQKAIEMAKKAEETYISLPGASGYNTVYHKLNVSIALLLADSIDQAEEKCKEALDVARVTKDSDLLSAVYQDMATIVEQRKDFGKALFFSKASYNVCANKDISKSLNLAAAYLDVDSLVSCNNLLNSIHTEDFKYKYIIFNIRHKASIKEREYEKSCNFADSAYHYLELMYGKQLVDKQQYYKLLAETKYENGIVKGEAGLLAWLIALTSIFSITIIIFILYSFRQYRKYAKIKIKEGKEKLIQEEKVYNEKLHYQELQNSTMRNFILKKIDIAQKIQTMRVNKSDNVLLTDEDWEEIYFFVDSVEGNFVTRLQKSFPKLDDGDLHLLILLRLKMPTKALALIYGISEKSIKQKLFVYKAKVGISGEKISLRTFIETF